MRFAKLSLSIITAVVMTLSVLPFGVFAAAPVITTSHNLLDGLIDSYYELQLEAQCTETVLWIYNEGDLPSGLTLSSSGLLSGTPAESGTFVFTVSAKNGSEFQNREFTLRIKNHVNLEAAPVARLSDTSATVTFGNDTSGIGKVGTYFWQLDGTAPENAEALITSGTSADMFAGVNSINLTSITSGTHHVYIAAMDENEKISNMLTVRISAVVSISVTAGEGGSVTGDISVDEGLTETCWYEIDNPQLELMAEPNDGFRFVGWTIDSDNSEVSVHSGTTANPLNISVPAEGVALTANFEIDDGYTLTVIAATGGSVTGTQSGSYEAGSPVKITAIPSSGYRFVCWAVNGVTIPSVTANPAEFLMPSGNVTITAVFGVTTTTTTRPGGGNPNTSDGNGLPLFWIILMMVATSTALFFVFEYLQDKKQKEANT